MKFPLNRDQPRIRILRLGDVEGSAHCLHVIMDVTPAQLCCMRVLDGLEGIPAPGPAILEIQIGTRTIQVSFDFPDLSLDDDED